MSQRRAKIDHLRAAIAAERAEGDRLAEALRESEASLRLLADRAYGMAEGAIERRRVLGVVRTALDAFEAARRPTDPPTAPVAPGPSEGRP